MTYTARQGPFTEIGIHPSLWFYNTFTERMHSRVSYVTGSPYALILYD